MRDKARGRREGRREKVRIAEREDGTLSASEFCRERPSCEPKGASGGRKDWGRWGGGRQQAGKVVNLRWEFVVGMWGGWAGKGAGVRDFRSCGWGVGPLPPAGRGSGPLGGDCLVTLSHLLRTTWPRG